MRHFVRAGNRPCLGRPSWEAPQNYFEIRIWDCKQRGTSGLQHHKIVEDNVNAGLVERPRQQRAAAAIEQGRFLPEIAALLGEVTA